jgi:hypothetical protein
MLFSPEAHEALADGQWSAATIRAAIATIAADAESAFDDGWTMHPLDAEEGDEPGARFRTMYLGGAGVVAALHRLAQRGFVELQRDYHAYLEQSLAAPPDFADEDPERSLWMGETGIRLVLQRLAPSSANLARLAELIAANEEDERCELMWGSPGTILAGRELGLDISAGVEWLRRRRDVEGVWTQHLYGRSTRWLGPAHGFAGCALAIGDLDDVSETLQASAVEEDGLVNWPPIVGRRLDENGDGLIRTQWCHGAPGIVATLGHLLDEELAISGGELTWRAGPLRKGANLCHGTAGNGYAFLALLERTGDERWLARARAFGMHAAHQVEQSRAEHGRGRQTLWTGDLGTALYLADCVDGAGELPLP